MGAPRIFVSYRSADGTDKATALARDLGQVFGDRQVFLDKDDLRGGSAWRREVGRTLSQRPVLLLLVTPELFAASDADGRRRIDDLQDPVRREIETALAAQAELIPILCDGVEALPPANELPAEFQVLHERTWRRLRAHDWARDVARLVEDLRSFGLRAGPAPARRGLLVGAALALGGAVLAVGAWWQQRRSSLSGTWIAEFAGETVRVELQHDADRLTLESHPIDIRARADWADYRAFWQRRHGDALDAVRYRGEGSARAAAGSPLSVDLGFQTLSVPGDVHVDGGNLSVTLGDDGRLAGTRWLNSAQAVTPATLVRE